MSLKGSTTITSCEEVGDVPGMVESVTATLTTVPAFHNDLLATIHKAVQESLERQLPELLPRFTQGVVETLRTSGVGEERQKIEAECFSSSSSLLPARARLAPTSLGSPTEDTLAPMPSCPSVGSRPTNTKHKNRRSNPQDAIPTVSSLENMVDNMILRRHDRTATVNSNVSMTSVRQSILSLPVPALRHGRGDVSDGLAMDTKSSVTSRGSLTQENHESTMPEVAAPGQGIPRVMFPVNPTTSTFDYEGQTPGSPTRRGMIRRQTTKDMLKASVNGLVEEFGVWQRNVSNSADAGDSESAVLGASEVKVARSVHVERLMTILKLMTVIFAGFSLGVIVFCLFNDSHACECRLAARIPLAAGALIGCLLVFFGPYARKMEELLAFLNVYLDEAGLLESWRSNLCFDSFVFAIIWMGSSAATLWEEVRIHEGVPEDPLEIAHLLALCYAYFVIQGLALYLTYICRGLALTIDFFCCATFQPDGLVDSIHEWNRSSALLRKASSAAEGCLVTLQAVLTCTLPLLLFDVYIGKWGVITMLPTIIVLTGILRIMFFTGALSEKCSRVPALLCSMNVPKHEVDEAERLIQHICHSQAGFYVGHVRMTTIMTIKFLYVWLVVAFTIVARFNVV